MLKYIIVKDDNLYDSQMMMSRYGRIIISKFTVFDD